MILYVVYKKKKEMVLKTTEFKSLTIISIISRVLKVQLIMSKQKVNEDFKPAFRCFKKIFSQHNSLLWISACLLWNIFNIWFFLICLIWCQWILLIRLILFYFNIKTFYESTFWIIYLCGFYYLIDWNTEIKTWTIIVCQLIMCVMYQSRRWSNIMLSLLKIWILKLIQRQLSKT